MHGRMAPKPTGYSLLAKSQAHSAHSTSGMTSSWVAWGGVLFENDSKTCKRDKAWECALETSMPVRLPGSIWYLVLCPPWEIVFLYCSSCWCSSELSGCWIQIVPWMRFCLIFIVLCTMMFLALRNPYMWKSRSISCTQKQQNLVLVNVQVNVFSHTLFLERWTGFPKNDLAEGTKSLDAVFIESSSPAPRNLTYRSHYERVQDTSTWLFAIVSNSEKLEMTYRSKRLNKVLI